MPNVLPHTDGLWVIRAVTDARNIELPKFVERSRVGCVVRSLFPLEESWRFQLQYVGGFKDGGVIQHSYIERIERLDGDRHLRIFTQNTMVELESLNR